MGCEYWTGINCKKFLTRSSKVGTFPWRQWLSHQCQATIWCALGVLIHAYLSHEYIFFFQNTIHYLYHIWIYILWYVGALLIVNISAQCHRTTGPCHPTTIPCRHTPSQCRWWTGLQCCRSTMAGQCQDTTRKVVFPASTSDLNEVILFYMIFVVFHLTLIVLG